MNSLENVKQSLLTGDLKLLNKKILVQLSPLPQQIDGIIVLPSEHYETDGGKIRTRTSEQKYSPFGTVISSDDPLFPPNTKVIVSPSSTLHSTFDPTLQFTDKSLILIYSNQIDAIYEKQD